MIEPLYREHASTVGALAYRMTGSAPDAEEITQETFTRALASPPPDGLSRNWLLSVAANLSRDRLRRRKRAAYVGAWLPSAVEAEADASDPESRYGLRESASFAFLLALEPLTSRQRAVLLLRDVFDLSVEETAAALEMSAGAVRVMHHRARAALAGYDEQRAVPTRERLVLVRSALERLAAAVRAGDPAEVQAVLADQATLHADGAAASAPFVSHFGARGRWRVSRSSVSSGWRGSPTVNRSGRTSTEPRRWSSMQRHHRERTFLHGSCSAATSTARAASPDSTCWRPRPSFRTCKPQKGLASIR